VAQDFFYTLTVSGGKFTNFTVILNADTYFL